MASEYNLKELLDLSNQELTLNEIIKLNNENEKAKAVYDSQMNNYIEKLKAEIEESKENENIDLESMIDLTRIEEKDYVKNLIKKLSELLSEAKEAFDNDAKIIKEELLK